MAGSAHAQERWVRVTTTVDGATVDIDRQTLRRSGASVTVWQRRTDPRADREGTQVRLSQFEYDCANATSDLLAYVNQTLSGGVIHSGAVAPHERERRPISPNSVAEGVWEAICR